MTDRPTTKHYVMRGKEVKIEPQHNGEWRVTYNGKEYIGEVYPTLEVAEDEARKHCDRRAGDGKPKPGGRVTQQPPRNASPVSSATPLPPNSYEMVPPDSLVGADYNPNTMAGEDFGALVTEVRNAGRLLKPIIVREVAGQRIIVDGHYNWEAATIAGLAAVPIERIEADEFEARRQTLIRNRTGRKDNLKLGRVYRDMLAERQFSNRELGDLLGLSEGSIRNQLLYPQAWDLLREKGERGMAESGQPMQPECYSWHGHIFTETTISKFGVRDIRTLIARFEGLVEDEIDQPGTAEPKARILARLKRAWDKATDDERREFIEWTGVASDLAQLIKAARNEGFNEGHAFAKQAAEAKAARNKPEQPEPARNGYAERGAAIRAAREAQGLTAKELAKRAGVAPNYVSMAELCSLTKSGGPAAGRPTFAKLEAALGLEAAT
jgi:ParB-like chromosome segregation protein Spo0J